ncbi:MAG: hypothetical protein K1X53_00380, partial [Candidatus Sumerlaeaceae bacterium]|nr:hypothetical protein [Candidatus Sumerlaeaceae bacterium]
TGIESYFVDHNAYPPMCPLKDFAKDAEVLERIGGGSLSTMFAGDGRLEGLTTPVSYITSLFMDPFSPNVSLPFAYYCDENGWICFSPGPDGQYDLAEPGKYYTSKIDQPSTGIMLLSYDPSNGTISGGDVWRVKQ